MRDKLEKQNDEQRQIEIFFYHVIKNVDNTTRYIERQKKKKTQRNYIISSRDAKNQLIFQILFAKRKSETKFKRTRSKRKRQPFIWTTR